MFSTLFKRKTKLKSGSPSASEFLKQPHVQEYMAKVRDFNRTEAENDKKLDEWVRKKDEALKNVDLELLNELCDALVNKHRRLSANWYNIGRYTYKSNAKFKQIDM